MRKQVRGQCEQLIENLTQAHQMIATCVSMEEYETLRQVLEACQNTAIALGGVIETSEGEGTDAVAELEHYCELLYQLSNGEGSVDQLDESVTRVSALVHDFPETREVVFLPYKVSMWDSLESEWRKMEDDPTVHAVVIPIPYFEKNEEGMATNFVYEGDRYPEDVPVVRYDTYNLEEKHPDAIYIHNPYDDKNLVTTVHPDYYSSKLKEYTDELVYIPYYVLADPDLNNVQRMEKLSHFVMVPGVLNADKILIQSETMREAYLRILQSRFGVECREKFKRIIKVQESPKVYRVKHPKPEDLEIPAEWAKVICREDGSKRKVIFYNTTVNAMINFEKSFVEKLHRVMDIFYENREDVVLLWRPHPLMEATLSAMEPQLQEEYNRIVDNYCKSGWGIYDESSEMYRAIQLSDAYYGDPSSVLELYKITGKPIMIENVNI